MKEYAFDVKLAATVRVKAESLSAAKALLETYGDDIDEQQGFGMQLTSCSVDDCSPHLFEVCGVDDEVIYWEEGSNDYDGD